MTEQLAIKTRVEEFADAAEVRSVIMELLFQQNAKQVCFTRAYDVTCTVWFTIDGKSYSRTIRIGPHDLKNAPTKEYKPLYAWHGILIDLLTIFRRADDQQVDIHASLAGFRNDPWANPFAWLARRFRPKPSPAMMASVAADVAPKEEQQA